MEKETGPVAEKTQANVIFLNLASQKFLLYLS